MFSTRITELLFQCGDFCFQRETLLVEQCLAIGLFLFKIAQILGKFLKSLVIGVGYYAGGIMSVNQALQTPKTHARRLRDKANREVESTAYEK